MSFPDLRLLNPPEFHRICLKCGLMMRQLPWQIAVNNSWGFVCATCGKTILLSLLHRQLPHPFTEAELIDALCDRGLSRREADLWLRDLEKEGYILRNSTGLFWRDTCLDGKQHSENGPVVQPSPVEPISMKPRRPKRRYRKLTAEEVRWRCMKLSAELLEEGKPC
jgi:hypothetical protein